MHKYIEDFFINASKAGFELTQTGDCFFSLRVGHCNAWRTPVATRNSYNPASRPVQRCRCSSLRLDSSSSHAIPPASPQTAMHKNATSAAAR